MTRRFTHTLLAGALLATGAGFAQAETTLTIACGSVGQDYDSCKHASDQWARKTGNQVRLLSVPVSSTETLGLYQKMFAAGSSDVDVVMVDTAGRLPTQRHLMDELKKIRRVIGKAMDGAPHEVLLVLDGNTGQNMLAQVQAFDEAVQLTGLVVTKLDGTAKGGAIAALAHTRRDNPLPVYFIGVGEGVEDLQAFSAREFATALLD